MGWVGLGWAGLGWLGWLGWLAGWLAGWFAWWLFDLVPMCVYMIALPPRQAVN